MGVFYSKLPVMLGVDKYTISLNYIYHFHSTIIIFRSSQKFIHSSSPVSQPVIRQSVNQLRSQSAWHQENEKLLASGKCMQTNWWNQQRFCLFEWKNNENATKLSERKWWGSFFCSNKSLEQFIFRDLNQLNALFLLSSWNGFLTNWLVNENKLSFLIAAIIIN